MKRNNNKLPRCSFKLLIFALVCTQLCSFVFSEDPSDLFPNIRFTSDSRISDDVSISPVLDAETFAYTALVASGASDEEIPAYVEQLHNLYKQCKETVLAEATSDETRAEETLHFLYTSVISMYEENQTRVDTELSKGIYNCVSSAVLFMYMMKKENIPVTAVETPTHAFCTISIDGKQVDVETTNPWGYNPGVKKEVASDSLRGKKYVNVPAKKYANRHVVDDRRILSLIYINRMSVMQKKGNDEATIGLAIDALKLQNYSEQAYDYVHQSFNNTAVDYSQHKDHEKGIALIKIARELYGEGKKYQQYMTSAVKSIYNAYSSKKEFDNACACIETYKDILLNDDYIDLRDTATYNKLVFAINNYSFVEALAQVHENKDILSDKNYTHLISYAYSHEASILADSNDWLSIIAFIDEGLFEVPKDSTLLHQRSMYQKNYVIDVHNTAAELFNAGDVDGARKVIEDGLSVVGDNATLKNDLKTIQQQ